MRIGSRKNFQFLRIYPLLVIVAVQVPAGKIRVQIDFFDFVHAGMTAGLIGQIALRFPDFPFFVSGGYNLIAGRQPAPDFRRMRMRMPAAVIAVHDYQPQRIDPRNQILRHIVTVHITFGMGGGGRAVADMFAVEIDVIERQSGNLQLADINAFGQNKFPAEKNSAVILAVCIGKPDPAPFFRSLGRMSAKHKIPFQNDSRYKK